MARIAVLLAAYNGSEWIEGQINSILSQENVEVDIYVSIDVSVDCTLHKMQHMNSIYPCIKILPYGEKFGGAAKNFFRLIRDVNFDSYDYVSLSDQDDIWLPDKLFHGINRLLACSADAYSTDAIAFWDNGRKKLIKKSYAQRQFDYLFEAAGPGCTYIFSTSSFLSFKDFLCEKWESTNNVYLHDWMLYAFYRSNGFKWVIDSKPLILYRQHASNQVGVNAGFAAYKKRFLLIKNKWYRNQVVKIAEVLNVSIPNKLHRIKNFRELRRRPRDAFGLLLATLIGFV